MCIGRMFEKSLCTMQACCKFRGSTLPARLGSSHCQVSWVVCKEDVFKRELLFAVVRKDTEVNKDKTFRKNCLPIPCSVIVLETLFLLCPFSWWGFFGFVCLVCFGDFWLGFVWFFVFVYLRLTRLHAEDSMTAVN